MNIDETKVLLAFYINKVREDNGDYEGAAIASISPEDFKLACDGLYTFILGEIAKGKHIWIFLFSVMYSVVKSIEEFEPEIIADMFPLADGINK